MIGLAALVLLALTLGYLVGSVVVAILVAGLLLVCVLGALLLG